MPVKIPDDLPARRELENENIFVIPEQRAVHQDIRPLQIAIVNLMPTKVQTELQLVRLLSNTPLQVDIVLVHPETHTSKTTSQDHLDRFYTHFSKVEKLYFDGMIITGAPVETLPFEQVTYWDELRGIMEYTKENVFSTLYICWGAQAGLYYHYGIQKYPCNKKVFGVFDHHRHDTHCRLFRGFNDLFPIPHSRYTEVRGEDIESHPDLELLAESDEAGVGVVTSREGREVFITGHMEYEWDTLKNEYERDRNKGLPIDIPRHYFPNDEPSQTPIVTWRAHAHLLFTNWLNYYVYQETPYNLYEIHDVRAKIRK